MHIGILKTDAVRTEWVAEFGEYPDMFVRLVGDANPEATFSTWDVEEGVHPTQDDIDSVDGFIITGSKSSAYDDKQWIRDLEGLIQRLHAARKKMVGICFGHQIIAHAFGGRIGRASTDSRFVAEVTGLNGQSDMAAFAHQEHVVDAGDLDVIASSDHCKIVACRHPTRPIYTVQYHPEAITTVLDAALSCGDMNVSERGAFDDQLLTTDVSKAFAL